MQSAILFVLSAVAIGGAAVNKYVIHDIEFAPAKNYQWDVLVSSLFSPFSPVIWNFKDHDD